MNYRNSSAVKKAFICGLDINVLGYLIASYKTMFKKKSFANFQLFGRIFTECPKIYRKSVLHRLSIAGFNAMVSLIPKGSRKKSSSAYGQTIRAVAPTPLELTGHRTFFGLNFL